MQFSKLSLEIADGYACDVFLADNCTGNAVWEYSFPTMPQWIETWACHNCSPHQDLALRSRVVSPEDLLTGQVDEPDPSTHPTRTINLDDPTDPFYDTGSAE